MCQMWFWLQRPHVLAGQPIILTAGLKSARMGFMLGAFLEVSPVCRALLCEHGSPLSP